MVIQVSESATTLERFREILRDNYGIERCANFTFFNQTGVEITEDTFVLIKDGEIVYYETAQGKQFDFNNILAQYEVLEKVGKGGFGSVHRARHRDTGKVVAVKYIDISAISSLP